MTPKIRNTTKVKACDHQEKDYEGKPKLIWTSRKNNGGDVPREVGDFIKEFLEGLGQSFFPNVSFRGLLDNLRFYYFLPDLNTIIDYLEKKTDKDYEEWKTKKEFCKKNNLKYICINKFKFKNIGGWIES